ncbi:MAG: hypothetical protein QOH42_1398 [Blastocatellia bacterium]|nr:hypothetical protein [Blastocatellia bacterium]
MPKKETPKKISSEGKLLKGTGLKDREFGEPLMILPKGANHSHAAEAIA